MRLFIHFSLILGLLFTCFNCAKENPTQPQNHSPEILSLDAFPDTIGLSDSVIVICEAIDPDGDTLVYDWITDGRVRIKGYNHSWLYNTSDNTHIFYPTEYVNFPMDTLWIQCFARDGRGKSDNGTVVFIVKQN